ncbi:MAG: hypothetical protein GF418_01035 [Chitinivibrionales bacterium]|nr:hypothetical protein [Chitinivibrionales bacterium]
MTVVSTRSSTASVDVPHVRSVRNRILLDHIIGLAAVAMHIEDDACGAENDSANKTRAARLCERDRERERPEIIRV